MQITFLGGASEIGASSIFLEICDTKLLIDAGIRPKRAGVESLPALDGITERPDALILTHAHTDHIGAVPVVHKKFPGIPVLASAPTVSLSKVMLLDSAYLQQQILPGEPIYTKSDVEETMTHIRSIRVNRWYNLSSQIAMCMVPAGHLFGAVSLLFDTSEGRLVITGDVSTTHQRAVPGFAAPRFQADILIMESTYGGEVHPPRIEEERRLVESVTEVVMAGGTALVPSFALGRAQEVMLTLKQAQQAQEIPRFPILADGLVRAVTEIYGKQREYLAPALRYTPDHPFWGNGQIVKVKASKRENIPDRPSCIISSSGMMLGGPSVFYAKQLLEDPANAIFITGYTDEESPGRRVQELGKKKKLRLEGKDYSVNCQIRKFGLSGHADAAQLAQLVEHFRPRLTLLVHGEQNAREALKERLPDHFSVTLPMNKQFVKLDKPNWMLGKPPYFLNRLGIGSARSMEATDVVSIAGDAPDEIPRLGIQEYDKMKEGALVREALPSRFHCLYCSTEKLVTIDLGKRKVFWKCPHCERASEDMIMNLKQKDISKLTDPEQRLVADLVLVSLYLQEPTLGRDWPELVMQPELWRQWVDKIEGKKDVVNAPARGSVEDETQGEAGDGFEEEDGVARAEVIDPEIEAELEEEAGVEILAI